MSGDGDMVYVNKIRTGGMYAGRRNFQEESLPSG